MRLLNSLLIASSCLLSFLSAATCTEPDLGDCTSSTAFTCHAATTFSLKVSDDTISYPLCLLKAPDDSWRLMIHKPLNEGRHLLISFEEIKVRTSEDKRNLTQKVYNEIFAMCNLMPTSIWTLDAFKTSFLWRGVVTWNAPRNIAVGLHKLYRLIKMGFEVESSVVKIRPGKGDKTYMMDVFESSKAPWAFTSDTLDNSLQSAEVAWMNTECKTIDGLSYDQIDTALKEMHTTWETLVHLCKDKTSDHHITKDSFSTEVKWKNDNYRKADVWTPFLTPEQQARLAYPQISYSLPLELLPAIFHRLYDLTLVISTYEDTSDLVRFVTIWLPPLNDAFSSVNDEQLLRMKNTPGKSPAVLSRINTEINRRTQHKLLLAFKDSVATTPPSSASGLAYLFFFYTYQLFSENMYIKEKEPGPKPMLAVMSRVPFSVMYNNLSVREQEKFRKLIESNLTSFFNNKLRKYKTTKTDAKNNYIDLSEAERITLGQWYQSIIAAPSGLVDLLSPPPGCAGCQPPYGMGAYKGTTIPNEFALIEARGYSRLLYNGEQITIDNVTPFIQNEARWFFTFQQS